jgi:hypothetical protein
MKDFLVGLTELAPPYFFVIALIVAIVLFIIYYNGIHLKFGKLEIDIGGLRRALIYKELDDDIRTHLHKFMNEVDKYLYADISSITEDLEDDLLKIYKGSCYFPMTRYVGIIKQELYKRINYNDLKNRLSLYQKDVYISDIKKSIKDKYLYFQNLTEETTCEDTYPPYEEIAKNINSVIDDWAKKVIEHIIKRCQQKIAEYTKVSKTFKIQRLKEKYCLCKINDNIEYIKQLGGKIIEV